MSESDTNDSTITIIKKDKDDIIRTPVVTVKMYLDQLGKLIGYILDYKGVALRIMPHWSYRYTYSNILQGERIDEYVVSDTNLCGWEVMLSNHCDSKYRYWVDGLKHTVREFDNGDVVFLEKLKRVPGQVSLTWFICVDKRHDDEPDMTLFDLVRYLYSEIEKFTGSKPADNIEIKFDPVFSNDARHGEMFQFDLVGLPDKYKVWWD